MTGRLRPPEAMSYGAYDVLAGRHHARRMFVREDLSIA